MTNAERGAALVGLNARGLIATRVIVPRPSLQFSVLRLQLAGNLFEVLTEQLDRDQMRGAGVYS